MRNTLLPEDRKQLLVDKFFQFSFREIEPDQEFFKTITNPLEYHFIVDMYNWDDGAEVLTWIASNEICDKGTAKMIFWRSQPSYYTRFLTADEAEWDADIFTLNKLIIENFETGFYKGEEIYYNPKEDPSAEGTDEIDPKAKWEIPGFMKDASAGTKVKFD